MVMVWNFLPFVANTHNSPLWIYILKIYEHLPSENLFMAAKKKKKDWDYDR